VVYAPEKVAKTSLEARPNPDENDQKFRSSDSHRRTRVHESDQGYDTLQEVKRGTVSTPGGVVSLTASGRSTRQSNHEGSTLQISGRRDRNVLSAAGQNTGQSQDGRFSRRRNGSGPGQNNGQNNDRSSPSVGDTSGMGVQHKKDEDQRRRDEMVAQRREQQKVWLSKCVFVCVGWYI
jgi:hypothetical protein